MSVDVKTEAAAVKEEDSTATALSNPSKLAGTGDTVEDKILSQVEYYFGDNNFPRDKFMKTECAKDSGWIKVNTLLTFNRLKALVKDLSDDKQTAKIAEVLKASTLVDVDESETKLRRNPDVPLDPNTEARTVYLKGFPKTETKLDDLLGYFKKYEGVEAVIMRWYKEKTFETDVVPEKSDEVDATVKPEAENGSSSVATDGKVVWIKKFKGSILVVFKSTELATKFLGEPEITYMGNKIDIKMMLSEYKKLKRDEYVTRVAARNKKIKGSKDSEGTDNKVDVSEPPSDIVKGALFKIKDIPANFSREDFKEKWYAATNEEDYKINFIDFNKGATEGIIRLEKEGAAISAVKLLPEGKLKAGEDKFIQMEVMEGDEEQKYLDTVTEKRMMLKRRHPGGFQGGRGGRGRGRGGGRGGKRRRY